MKSKHIQRNVGKIGVPELNLHPVEFSNHIIIYHGLKNVTASFREGLKNEHKKPCAKLVTMYFMHLKMHGN